MPNWTSNNITLSHDDPAMIDKIEKRPEDQGILQTLIPCPEELNNPELTTWGHGDEEEARKALRAQMIAKYGFQSWYEWNIAHWGTKWDLCDTNENRVDDNTIEIYCQTAWSPPVEAFETLLEQGYRIRALYAGEGYEYAGIWDNGVDQYYSNFENSDHAASILPQELDDAFGISESIAQWEEENEEYEDLIEWIKEGVEAMEKKDA